LVLEDMARLDRFLSGGYDLLRAPYIRGREQLWTPVRGSCSVAREGIASLRAWLLRESATPEATWPEQFHVDETWLARWWEASRRWLNVMTYVDRTLPPFLLWPEVEQALKQGNRIAVEGQWCAQGPMRAGTVEQPTTRLLS
jgi:hypothetical protein